MSAPSLSGPPTACSRPVFPTVCVTRAGGHSHQLSGDKATVQAGLAGTSCPPLLPPWRDPSGLPEHKLSPQPRSSLWGPAWGQDPLEGLLPLGT